MAVIIETEEGEAISEATGVTESEPGLLSRPPVVEAERELATLRLKCFFLKVSVVHVKRVPCRLLEPGDYTTGMPRLSIRIQKLYHLTTYFLLTKFLQFTEFGLISD